MTTIVPISDLRNHFSSISERCHKESEPIYLTKNGKGDLVVMSIALYEKNKALLELYEKLAVAQRQSDEGLDRTSHEEVIKKLRNR
ncbi:MAG: type II toxin-antitoxin system Phd/YefM family antitoxin [Candidatus Thermoplasmatota archaeon]|nr:type II toxin-antitoxin system Phd/YefM family antitoxin [Candidatus Thermoplasmatota archaeon]